MMPTVYLCSPTNSTMFTTCCNTAICDDQAHCPRCGEEVTPRSHLERWRTAHEYAKLRGYGRRL